MIHGMKIFRHTSSETGMWRGWLRSGQVFEANWQRGTGFALRVLIHSNDADQGDRMINVALCFGQVFIPIGISQSHYSAGDEPSWGFNISREFGINLTWGYRRKHFDWPFRTEVLVWDYELAADGWSPVRGSPYPREATANVEVHPYRYTLRSGVVQEVEATIWRERWIRGRRFLHRLGWPKRESYTISVEFSDEVGERAGSWKGGTVGCCYEMRSGETPIDTLRRMERERKF